MKLLYRTAELHSLLKLRLHTDETLERTEQLIMEYGKLMRQFRDTTCADFDTLELPREMAARIRREAENTMAGINSTATGLQPNRKKQLNLCTIKFHALGDYTQYIRKYGTTDSYTTQLVCIQMHQYC